MHTWILVPIILAAVSPLLAFEVICKPKSFRMLVARRVSLKCSCKCESKCAAERIIWTKDDHVLQAHPPVKNLNNQTVNDRFQFIYQNIENGEVSLDIENLQLSDSGTYKCTIVINRAYRQGTIKLQVSEPDVKHYHDVTEQPDPIQKSAINLNHLPCLNGFVGAAGALVVVISVLAFACWKKKLGCSHFQKEKKLPNTGDGEESKTSTGSYSTVSEMIKKGLKMSGQKYCKAIPIPSQPHH